MVLGPPNRKIMYISDDPPDCSDPRYSGWLDTKTRTTKAYEGGQWVIKAFWDREGYTGEIKHGNDTMVFENGVLVKYG